MIVIKSILFALAMALIVECISGMIEIRHSTPSFGAIMAFFMSLPNYIQIERMLKK